ncbi:MAG: hypothetical protein CFE24_02235 [Flavobacterium sp. BFFFF2]|nr:MAG: hypothetical protein CFE24_02235 [Flavobacterium sp. BFFFF2]
MTKYLTFLISILLVFSCAKEVSNKDVVHMPIIREKSNDSIIIELDKNDKITSVYRFSNGDKKVMREKIAFLPNGKIDYSKSAFLEVRGKDLYFRSIYDSKYPIPKKRYAQYIGNKYIKPDFSNFEKLKLDSTFFRENGKISNYSKVLSRRGKIIETIFLDTVIKVKNDEDQIVIRSVEYEIDLDNLLIKRVQEIKNNK